ncbi:histone-lysine N-methyltransferase, H3 lysine-9 specific SUVH1-like [Canna indica]|uniref:Histone-lysine N-methyltransferase, H3 lysine-9 specific SUVH1-like n=1 Tax=Canna indica TaxID=4628 RepID=A0AAQ3KZK4_9LILI|nr:histone-lysine N-methyltransferase, H3 lysine-9 specific SUVH1-like [Canna indica]
MEGRSSTAPHSSNESVVLDAKPLRTLAPMLPAVLGEKSTYTPPNASPFTCVTPLGPFATESNYPPGFCPFFPSSYAPQDLNQRPVELTFFNVENGFSRVSGGYDINGPLQNDSTSPFFHTPPPFVSCNEDDEVVTGASSPYGRMAKRSSNHSGGTEGSSRKKVKPRRPKAAEGDLGLLPSSLHDPREYVEVVLTTFDALRRRLMQIDEAKRLRQDLKAGTIMMTNDLRANMVKRIGQIPGVDVGDIFYFRIEMCLVGLHSQSVAGIDYMTVRFGSEEDPVAIGIVSAGVYDNEEDNVDVLVYSGQGSSSKDDQKLERGNLALERSLHRSNEVRVIRSVKDPNVLSGKVYVYDGLYKIRESWVEKGKSGFNTFKYKILREPGQPDGIAVWKNTEKWKQNPSSRGNTVILLDISSGIESTPVCLVNEVDNEQGPSYFTYSTTVSHSRVILSSRHLHSCMCINACLPGDTNCSCLHQNGGVLPYTSNGILISRKPLVYECSASCQCTINCRNRVTQAGIQHRFEVFRTRDRGWGLRCWDAIRAGTFICEYIGEIIDNIQSLQHDEENEYLFQPMYFDQGFKWNYVPELLGEPSSVDPNETSKSLSFVINAKNMGNISRFMNHSCSPNVFWQPVLYDHSDDQYPHIMFFAIKHIPPMAELTYDYGPHPAEMGDRLNFQRRKKCLCGTVKCRGFFG